MGMPESMYSTSRERKGQGRMDGEWVDVYRAPGRVCKYPRPEERSRLGEGAALLPQKVLTPRHAPPLHPCKLSPHAVTPLPDYIQETDAGDLGNGAAK